MNTRKLLVWVGAFLIVAGVVTTAGILRARRPSERSQLFFPELTQDRCAAIEIREKEKNLRLRRKGDIWVVAAVQSGVDAAAHGGLAALPDADVSDEPAVKPAPPADRDYPVDSAMLASLMEKLEVMKRDELVSQNPEKQNVFEVDSAGGVFVSVRDAADKVLAAFRIGKNGPGWSSHYVRRDGSNNVYLVRGSIKHSFVADADRWRDKTIIRFSAPSARRVTLVKETGTTITMERTTDSTGAPSWMLIAPVRQQADANKVDEVINTLARFTCMGWESNTALSDDSLGFVRPKLTARIELDGGSERVVHVGKKVGAENKYWVRSPSHEDITFHVGSYTVEKLDTSADDLKAALNEEEVS